MGRKTETDEQKVKKVYPHSSCVWHATEGQLCGYVIFTSPLSYGEIISELSATPDLAWSDALRQINANKRKKYYKRKITRPNNEKKGKVNIMMYPSDKTAIIGKYGSVQKFINTIVEQLKLAKNEVDKN